MLAVSHVNNLDAVAYTGTCDVVCKVCCLQRHTWMILDLKERYTIKVHMSNMVGTLLSLNSLGKGSVWRRGVCMECMHGMHQTVIQSPQCLLEGLSFECGSVITHLTAHLNYTEEIDLSFT